MGQCLCIVLYCLLALFITPLASRALLLAGRTMETRVENIIFFILLIFLLTLIVVVVVVITIIFYLSTLSHV